MTVLHAPSHIPIIWDEVKDSVQSALSRGSIYTLDDIYEGLMTSHFQLWTHENVVLVTNVHDDYCLLLALSGKHMGGWLSQLKIIEAWSRLSGCQRMLIHGRKGWSRILEYEITGRDELGLYIMSKNLWVADQKQQTDNSPTKQAPFQPQSL